MLFFKRRKKKIFQRINKTICLWFFPLQTNLQQFHKQTQSQQTKFLNESQEYSKSQQQQTLNTDQNTTPTEDKPIEEEEVESIPTDSNQTKKKSVKKY